MFVLFPMILLTALAGQVSLLNYPFWFSGRGLRVLTFKMLEMNNTAHAECQAVACDFRYAVHA